ncbi:unnamed protein product [Sphagnum balticum]
MQDDDFVVAYGHYYSRYFEIETIRSVNFLVDHFQQGQSVAFLELGDHADMFEVIYEICKENFFFFFEMGEYVSLICIFADISDDESGVGLAIGLHRVHDIIVQHHIFEVSEATYLFVLPYAFHNTLVLGEHVIKDYLLGEHVYHFVVIDAVGVACPCEGLAESKAFLEAESHSVLEVTAVVEHGFAFLFEVRSTSLEPLVSA